MQHKQKFCLSLLICLLVLGPVISQTHPFWNKEMLAIAKPSSKEGWIDIREEAMVNAEAIFLQHPEAFQLQESDDMRIKKVEEDNYGFRHYRYDQFYKEVRVFGGEYIVHVNPQGLTYCANGDLYNGIQLNVNPKLNEAEALVQAMNYADGNGFLWLDENAEKNLKEREQNDNATFYPKGELLIFPTSLKNSIKGRVYELAWAFDFYMGLTGEARKVFVHANTGEFVHYIPISMSCDDATGTTTWHGIQTIKTDLVFGTFYALIDDCTLSHPYTLRTYNLNRDNDEDNREEYLNNGTNWTSQQNITGVQCHWAMHQTRDYYSDIHLRNGWDNSNGNWIAYNEVWVYLFGDGVSFFSHNSSGWGRFGNIATFGGGDSDTSPDDDYNTLDIVGHEFTHGVVQTSANLNYQDESGALNESFGDIFGEMVELYTRGTHDWKIRGDADAIRNLQDPSLHNHPNTYMGTNWCDYTNENLECTDEDNGGVHTNSGVQNYWFYLLAVGGSGINDNGDAYEVTGIGREKARNIAYRNLTVYLTSNSDYTDAREGALRAATDLYGFCSNEAIQVGKAWFAVGVGTELMKYDYQLCGNYTSDIYWGINSVQAAGICNTNANFILGDIVFAAGNEVVLKDGFAAFGSSDWGFRAYTESCAYTVLNLEENEAEDLNQETERKELTEKFALPSVLELKIAPNPASNQTTIFFNLPQKEKVKISITDLNGKVHKIILPWENRDSGQHQLTFNGSHLSPGIYLCRIQTDTEILTKRLLIAR